MPEVITNPDIIKNGTYHCNSSLPIVNEFNPEDFSNAIAEIKYIPAGEHFTIMGYEVQQVERLYKERNEKDEFYGPWLKMPGTKIWYKVKSASFDGFINGIALTNKSLKRCH